MEVKILNVLRKNEIPAEMGASIVFFEGNSRKFATLDAEIKEGDELKALEALLKYCGTLKTESAQVEAKYGQKVRTIAPRILQNIEIGGRLVLKVDENAGVKGLAVPSAFEADNITPKKWRCYKHELHNVCAAFVEVCTMLTVEQINAKTVTKDEAAEAETETPTEAPKAKDKKEKAKA